MINVSLQYIVPNFHSKQHNNLWIKLLFEMGLKTKLVLYKRGAWLLLQLMYTKEILYL